MRRALLFNTMVIIRHMEPSCSVFTNMYTLLAPQSSAPWPISLTLPLPDSIRASMKEEAEVGGKSSFPSKHGSPNQVSACPHTNRKHYAKNMCSVCYHRFGRRKLAWNCDHRTRFNYSKGLCQPCYLRNYIRSRPKVEDITDF